MSRFMLINVCRPVLAPCRGLRRSAHRADTVQMGQSPSLWKPLGFAVTVSGASVGGAALWQYEAARAAALRALTSPFDGLFRQRNVEGPWTEVVDWWSSLSPGQRLFVPVCAANVAVFLAWGVPRFQPVMLQYFCSNPYAASNCWPMLLSVFSHQSALHLMANMYVLHSFSSVACAALGPEPLAAMYLSAGVWSSLASYCVKAVRHTPGLSLGASGAIMAVLAFVCCEIPDTRLSIIFLPMFTFSAASALKGILLLDSAGLVLGWRMFDHAAHLGGAVVGIAWSAWGREVWRLSEPALRAWHQFRGAAVK